MSKVTAEETTIEETTAEEVVVDEPVVIEGAENEEPSTEGEETKEDETFTEDPAKEETTDEVVVTIGDETPPSKEEEELKQAPEWVRELRRTSRETARENKELKRQLAEKAVPAETAALGPKPKLADFDFDNEQYEAALDKWKDQQRAANNESAQRQAAERKQQEAWQVKLNEYGESKTKLKVKDFAEAEAVTSDALSGTQQGIIVSGSDNAALVIYALGKNSEKLKELAAITDPVKFAFAVAKLERDLKVTTRKAPPPPEKKVTGSAPKSGVVDSTLERLRADAEKTGDYSKVIAHKRSKRTAAA